MQSTSKHS